MPSANPLPGYTDDTGAANHGLFWASSGSSAGAPAWYPGHSIMNDQGLTGAVSVDAGGMAGGNTHVYVGGLVLLALAGMILFHMLGFRAMAEVGSLRR